jgi:DNA-binding transcriptional ArsR family regulator
VGSLKLIVTTKSSQRARADAQPTGVSAARGDTDIAAIGMLLADRGRCRMLLALNDGRALPASRLAAEAGITPATASSHLSKLLAAGLLAVEPQGRNRYYRIAGAQVGQLLEILAQLAPAAPIHSLRQATRSEALREARSCYDHLAGRLGVALMASIIKAGYLTGGDGMFDPSRARRDKRVGYGHDIDYRLTPAGNAFLADLGVVLEPRRTPIRYCVDWSEQRHHLAGAAGRGLLSRLVELDWIRRSPDSRAVLVTDAGRKHIQETFGVSLDG